VTMRGGAGMSTSRAGVVTRVGAGMSTSRAGAERGVETRVGVGISTSAEGVGRVGVTTGSLEGALLAAGWRSRITISTGFGAGVLD